MVVLLSSVKSECQIPDPTQNFAAANDCQICAWITQKRKCCQIYIYHKYVPTITYLLIYVYIYVYIYIFTFKSLTNGGRHLFHLYCLMGKGMAYGHLPFSGTGYPVPDVANIYLIRTV